MRPVITWTLKQRKWSVIWWCIGVAALVILTMAFYPSVRNQANQLDQSLANIPQTARAFISDTNDLLSPVGYLSSQIFYLMLPLLLSILAIGLGSGLIAREEDSGTIELLLSRPISRGRLLAGKGLAGLVIILIVSAVAMAALLITCKLVSIDVSLKNIALATTLSVLLSLVFGVIAFSVTTLGRTARLASVGFASLIGLASYILASLSTVVSWLHWPARVLPYYYYKPGNVLSGAAMWRPAVGYLIVIAVLSLIGWLSFRRRDLNG